jgi:hypothetical protein
MVIAVVVNGAVVIDGMVIIIVVAGAMVGDGAHEIEGGQQDCVSEMYRWYSIMRFEREGRGGFEPIVYVRVYAP